MAREVIYRHRLVTRVTHWVNALAMLALLMSGLQILNAHPRLYWGSYGASADEAFIAFEAKQANGRQIGVTSIGPLRFETTGVLGVSSGERRGFPAWATVPSWKDLATGRNWHFFFAWLLVLNGLVYIAASLWNGHLRRDLAPVKRELRWGHLWQSIKDHALLHHPKGEDAKRYNTLQKLAYLSVIFVLAPLILLTGLTMSPGVNAAAPWMLDLFGGRQSARTLHFLAASGLVLFTIVHLIEVVIAGAWNEIRSMITGRYTVPE